MAAYQFAIGDSVRVIGGTSTYTVTHRFTFEENGVKKNAYDIVGDELGDRYSTGEESLEESAE